MPDGAHGEPGHNVGGVDNDRLLSIVQRFEHMEEEVKALRSDQKDLMTEAASAGFDKKTLRQVIRIRAMDQDKRDEADHLIALYRAALGV